MGQQPPRNPRTNESEEPTFDRRAVLAHMEGDRKLLREIVELFRQDSPRLLDRVGHAIESGDGPKLAGAAHALKGALSNFAATRSVELARNLESMGQRGELEAAAGAHRQLVAELGRLERDLDSFLVTGE
jgi:HPt (histidine-containing phosphotransfer) domain-containing protein